MARVKSLRRLCARFAARAKESAGRRRHLECNTSIRLPAIAREQKTQKHQSTMFYNNCPLYQALEGAWRKNTAAELVRARQNPKQMACWKSISFTSSALITLESPLKDPRASSQTCLVGQDLRRRSSTSKRVS